MKLGNILGGIAGGALGLNFLSAAGANPLQRLFHFGGRGGVANGGGPYTSGDGLVNLPNLSKADALDGFRSVLDFRHIYGPDTKVPNINFGGQLVSGRVGDLNPFEFKQPMRGGMFGSGMPMQQFMGGGY